MGRRAAAVLRAGGGWPVHGGMEERGLRLRQCREKRAKRPIATWHST